MITSKKFLYQIKKITNNPYLATIFLFGIHNLRELYSLSSSTNNWNNYLALSKAIKKCSPNNINPFLCYLKSIKNTISFQLPIDGSSLNSHELLHSHFVTRIFKGIKNTKLQIKNLEYSSWDDVLYYAQTFNIYFLPNRNYFHNTWLINLCEKYHFFEIKFDIWDRKLCPNKIENSFASFCSSLNINNHNLGNNELSIYIGEKYSFSLYMAEGKYVILKDLSAFAHEWAHYLDNRAYNDPSDISVMVHYNITSQFHSDLICFNKNMKPKNIKYYNLYSILNKIVFNHNTFTMSKYYKLCKNYADSFEGKQYWANMQEVFARLFEVYVSNKNQDNILSSPKKYYENYSIYPKINILEPIYKDINNFIKLSTGN